MKIAFLLLLLLVSPIGAEEQPVLKMSVASQKALTIGHVAQVEFIIKNVSDQKLVVLEIQPGQPCEESIELVRTLYGRIDYDPKADEYRYDSLVQTAAMVPVVGGLLFPGEEMTLKEEYRPFAEAESFMLSYAILTNEKVYAGNRQQGFQSRYVLNGTNHHEVILPGLVGMKKGTTHLSVRFDAIAGELSKLCYCEALRASVDSPPYTMYKEWDTGKVVEFRVGEKQEGIGPERRSAGWKFLDEFPVRYGDGMYTHGEFVDVTPDLAPVFMQKIDQKFSIRRIDYFLTEHYYDLEPME